MTHDFTKKGGVVHTEIMLPSHAPRSFADRSTLWNSVEEIEKSSTAQLAREIEVALPVELSRAEQLALVRSFVKDNFVDAGMCADFAIHDKGTGNPHAHILLTIRPIKENGEWGAKCRKVYDLDSQGQRIPDGKGGWKSHREDSTDWNQRGNAEKWRAAWAAYTNRALEAAGRPERIDHRSYKRQGVDKIPTVHMGPAASQMERRGIQTEKGNINREIAADNKLLKEIKARITRLYNWSKEQAETAAPDQGKATGEERRVSQRTADVSFGPDRAPDQGLAQRTPAKGKKRRQPPPPPEGRPTDEIEPSPAMRGADDVPVELPPPAEDNGQSRKRRQRKRGGKFRQNMAAPPARGQPEGGRLNFEDGSAPGPSPEPDQGRLRFEDVPAPDAEPAEDISAPPPPDDSGKKRRQRKQAQRFREDAAPSVQADAQDGGRLHFEDEGTPAAQDHATGQARPHLRFEDEEASAPDVDGGLDTPPPSHRQQRQYERAERRVEQSGRRLERAQAKLPVKRRARLEQEYDAGSGKVRRRLRFEEEVKPEQESPSLPAQAGHTLKMAAVMKLHGKFREVEHQNVAVEAAHKGEFAAERATGRFLRWNKRRLRSKPYRAARQAERRLAMDRAELAWQTALRDHPELRRQNVLSRWMQKQKIKRRYAQAAREAQRTAQHTRQMATAVGKIARAVQQYAAAHKSALLIVALLALVIAFFSAGLVSCTAMLSGAQSSYLSATYLSDEQEICNSELYFTELETDLQLNINGTAASFPGYDEYRYNVGEISHNPYELMSYLAAMYDPFTFEQVKPELDRLFSEKYQLTRTPITETRYDENGAPYQWKVLKTTLTVRRWADLMAETLTPGEQTERYGVYMQTYGIRQAFANPFDFPWLGYVSSPYGYRVHPTTGVKDLHRGVDIAAAQGTPVAAIHDGKVVSAGDTGSYGLCVVIEDDKGYQSRYAHCSTLSVSAGQEVRRGDVIGAVGSTGDSTGPHLHLEVMLNGEYLNPYYFVDTGGSGEPTGPIIPDYSGEPVGDDRFQAMLAVAEQYLGYPYVWGGTNPTTSFDCSGYVSWVINHNGWNYGRLGVMGLEDICTPVSAADAKPGDLVFFIGTYDAPYPNRPTHVGIYVGGGRMIHCGDPISYTSINTPYWQSHFYGFGRLPEP